MKHHKLSLFLVVALVSAAWSDPTASIFVKNAEEFATIRKDLEGLKVGLGSNAELDSLWEEANKIAKMNDRCSMISINEVLDDACNHFYAVELPAFETKYMEVTGELRLGSIAMGNSLAERTEQIKVCAAALGGILVSKEQLLKLNGTLDLEPLNLEGAFDATYNFSLYYDARRMEQQRRMMDRWLTKCGDIVLRKSGDEFAPLFLQSVTLINDSLVKAKANVKIVVEPEFLDFYLDLNKPVPGYYYLNGTQLFSVAALPTGRNYSHIIVNIPKKKVNLPLGVDGKMQTFKGRVEFTSVYQDKDLVGRWSWGLPKKNRDVVETKASIKEESTTIAEGDSAKLAVEARPQPKDTLAVSATEDTLKKDMAEMKAKEDAAKAAKEAAKDEKSGIRIHWIPLAIAGAVAVGGGVMAAVFNSKAKSERDKEPINPDEYNEHLDKIESAQTMRNVGIGLAIGGAVGAAVTFLF
ncbi:MAG: hypothetical protein IKX42_01670 [Fibrobacter sp.]|nr:hypothetical protein [Fibrobacter sp.]